MTFTLRPASQHYEANMPPDAPNRQVLHDVVRGCYSAFASRDLDAISRLTSTDCVFDVPGIERFMPWAHSHAGHSGIGELWGELDKHLIFDSFNATDYLVDEQAECVVVIGIAKCTSRKTGLSYVNNWAHLFRLTKGVVTYFREYPDTAAQLVVMHPF